MPAASLFVTRADRRARAWQGMAETAGKSLAEFRFGPGGADGAGANTPPPKAKATPGKSEAAGEGAGSGITNPEDIPHQVRRDPPRQRVPWLSPTARRGLEF